MQHIFSCANIIYFLSIKVPPMTFNTNVSRFSIQYVNLIKVAQVENKVSRIYICASLICNSNSCCPSSETADARTYYQLVFNWALPTNVKWLTHLKDIMLGLITCGVSDNQANVNMHAIVEYFCPLRGLLLQLMMQELKVMHIRQKNFELPRSFL